MRRIVIIALLVWICGDQMAAQRRGRRGRARAEGRALYFLKDICDYFVNDLRLTKAARTHYLADAQALARQYLRQQYPDTTIYSEELVYILYHHLVAIRLSDEPALQAFNQLGIHRTALGTPPLPTDIQLRYYDPQRQRGCLAYAIHGPEGIRCWHVYIEVCPFDYEVNTARGQPLDPLLFIEQRLHAALELAMP